MTDRTPFTEYFGLLVLQADNGVHHAPEPTAPLHGELLKAELRLRGSGCAAIAKRLGVSKSAVSLVIHRRATSARISAAIAEALRQPRGTA